MMIHLNGFDYKDEQRDTATKEYSLTVAFGYIV
jgi:hypothetical protein